MGDLTQPPYTEEIAVLSTILITSTNGSMIASGLERANFLEIVFENYQKNGNFPALW